MGEHESRFASLQVKDYMSSAPETLTPEDHLLNADLRIRRAGVRHLPVVSDGRLVGLLSERDVRRYGASILYSTPEDYNKTFEQTLVGTVMTRDVITIGPDAALGEATSLLHSQRLGCLPVMDGQQLVGIITRADLLRFANDALSGAR